MIVILLNIPVGKYFLYPFMIFSTVSNSVYDELKCITHMKFMFSGTKYSKSYSSPYLFMPNMISVDS